MGFALLLLLSLQDGLDVEVRKIKGLDLTRIDDAGFLRRATRDLLGRDATQAEVQAFSGDPARDKRDRKIGDFVASPEFDAHWAGRFTRLLFGDPERVRFTADKQVPDDYGVKAVQRFEEWFAAQLKKDRPYGEIVFDILDSRWDPAESPAAAYKLSLFRGLGFPQEFALAVPRHFMGVRLGCARCHDAPYDKWRTEDFHGLAAFAVRGVARIRSPKGAFDHVAFLESDEGDYFIPGLKATDPVKPVFPWGGAPGKNDNRFLTLGRLMTSSGADPLDRATVNRAWAWLTGRGFVDPVDDFKTWDKGPPALVGLLVKDFRDHNRSIKRLVRTVCGTELYQRQSETPWRGRPAFPSWNAPLKEKGPDLPFVFDAPASWTRWRTHDGFRFVLHLPDKEKKARDAELGVFSHAGTEPTLKGLLQDTWTARILDAKKGKVVEIQGKSKVLVAEVSGTYACEIDSDVPEEERVILASLALGGNVYFFRLQGPAAVVEGWRDDFPRLLKEACVK